MKYSNLKRFGGFRTYSNMEKVVFDIKIKTKRHQAKLLKR